jgi:hypothetical protein
MSSTKTINDLYDINFESNNRFYKIYIHYNNIHDLYTTKDFGEVFHHRLGLKFIYQKWIPDLKWVGWECLLVKEIFFCSKRRVNKWTHFIERKKNESFKEEMREQYIYWHRVGGNE